MCVCMCVCFEMCYENIDMKQRNFGKFDATRVHGRRKVGRSRKHSGLKILRLSFPVTSVLSIYVSALYILKKKEGERFIVVESYRARTGA